MTSPEPSFPLLFEFVDGSFSAQLLSMCGFLLFDKDGLIGSLWYTYLTYYQLGGYDHSVLDTFVQLTEGRSARDQPKQPPAKKNLLQHENS